MYRLDERGGEIGSDAEQIHYLQSLENSKNQEDHNQINENLISQIDQWSEQADYESRSVDSLDKEINSLETEFSNQYELSDKDIQQAKEELGLQNKLTQIKESTKNVYEKFKNKVGDVKATYLIEHTDYNKNLRLNKIGQKILDSMSDEQIMRHPEMMTTPIKQILEFFNKEIIESNNYISGNKSYVLEGITEIFDSHPKVIEHMFANPEVQAVQKQRFTQALYRSNGKIQQLAKLYKINQEQLLDWAIEACNERYDTNSKYNGLRINESEFIFSEVGLDFSDPRVQDLVTKEMLFCIKQRDLDFISSANNYYNLDRSTVFDYFQFHKQEFEKPMLDMVVSKIDRYHPHRVFAEIYPDYIKSIEKYSGIDFAPILANLPDEYRDKLLKSYFFDAHRDFSDEHLRTLLGRTSNEIMQDPEAVNLAWQTLREKLLDDYHISKWELQGYVKNLGIVIPDFIAESAKIFLEQKSLKGINGLLYFNKSLRIEADNGIQTEIFNYLAIKAKTVTSDELPLFFKTIAYLEKEQAESISLIVIGRLDLNASPEQSNQLIKLMGESYINYPANFIKSSIDTIDEITMSALLSKMFLLPNDSRHDIESAMVEKIQTEHWDNLLVRYVKNSLDSVRNIDSKLILQVIDIDPNEFIILFGEYSHNFDNALLAEVLPVLFSKLERNSANDQQYRKLVRTILRSNPEYKIPGVMSEYINSIEEYDIRTQQLEWSSLINTVLFSNRYDLLVEALETGGVEKTEALEIKERIETFANQFPVSQKGLTITVLTAMSEYLTDTDVVELIKRTDRQLQEYQKILDSFSPNSVPKGLRTSIGMEYEIMGSTASGYSEIYKHSLEYDMKKISKEANIKQGYGGIHEISTQPTDNPYLLLIEMQLLQQLDCIDFNFNKSEQYMKGARGYHLTVGGEKGLFVGRNMNFLQNNLVISGWGGINAGKDVDKLDKGRGRNIRQRYKGDENNEKLFENATPSVELRSLSLDTWEPFERTILTSYYGAMAIQAVENNINLDDVDLDYFIDNGLPESRNELIKLLASKEILMKTDIPDQVMDIIHEWIKLQVGVLTDLKDHNDNFLENETTGYFDDKNNWVDVTDFGGQNNYNRFMEQLGDDTMVQGAAKEMQIMPDRMFAEADEVLANKCTMLTNLFLKSGEDGKGDVINALSVLDTTKIGKVNEDADVRSKYLSVVETGRERQGYYYIQGGSEKMLIHAVQQRLLQFKNNMQRLVLIKK